MHCRTQDIIISISGIFNNIFICQSCVGQKKKDALLEHISSFGEKTEVEGLKQEVEEMRTEIKDKNLSLITQIK